MLQRFADALHSIGALDLVGALVVLLFLVLGFVRGFVGQAARLIAIVLGFFVARAGPPTSPRSSGTSSPHSGRGCGSASPTRVCS